MSDLNNQQQNNNSFKKSIVQFVKNTVKVFMLTVPVLVLIVYINYTVDPSSLYKLSREDSDEITAVDIMMTGQNATNIGSCNERLVRREYLNRMTQPAQSIALGSSRGAIVDSDMLGEQSFFNFSVVGATIEDFIGYYGLLHQNDLLPNKVYFVVDPWILNDNYNGNGQDRYKEAVGDGYYYYMTEVLNKEVDPKVAEIGALYKPFSEQKQSILSLGKDKLLNLFSITYFQGSLYSVLNDKEAQLNAIYTVEPTDNKFEYSDIIRFDGSYSYPEGYREVTTNEKTVRAMASLPESVLGLEDFDEINGENNKLLREFVGSIRDSGVEVEFLLLPISTVIYEHMEQNYDRYHNFFLSEETIRDIANEYGCSVVGSYNPYEFGFDMSSFYDGYHPTSESVAYILRQSTV